jgi:hypothetical protein
MILFKTYTLPAQAYAENDNYTTISFGLAHGNALVLVYK